MKKILVFTPSVSIPGGLERVMSNFANGLCGEYDIIFVSLDNNVKPFYEFPNEVAIESLDLNLLRKRSHVFLRIINSFKDIFKLRKLLKAKYGYNIIIGTDFIINIFLSLAALGLGKKIIAQEHMTFDLPLRKNYVKSVRNLFYKKFMHTVVTLTRYDQARYECLGIKAICIPNALTFVSPPRAKLDSKRILAIGRFNYQKGFDMLLKAVVKPLQQFPDWSLVLVGEGEDENQLRKIVAENLLTNVYIEKATTKIDEKYLNASFFILSSRFEGLPMVLLEAMSFGLPCISFDCKTGPSEIIIDNIDGILVHSNDIKALEDAITTMITNDELLANMSDFAYNNINRFSPKNVYNKWISFIDTLN